MAEYEDPKLTSSHEDSKITTIYREIIYVTNQSTSRKDLQLKM